MIALLVCAILVWVLVEDIRYFRVRNLAVGALFLCFPLECLVQHRLALLPPHFLLAAVSLVILAGAFFLGAVGGGDAKLLTAAMLWVGPEASVLFAIALLAATSLYTLGAWTGRFPHKRVGHRMAIPFGPSIAVAWMITIGLRAWA